MWAASVPLLIVGQFALLAVVPVLVVPLRTFRRPRLRGLRPWALGLTSAYALALLLWAVGPDRATSLSKDLNPAVAGLIVTAAGPRITLWPARCCGLSREGASESTPSAPGVIDPGCLEKAGSKAASDQPKIDVADSSPMKPIGNP